jgi:uncharacterized protein
MLPVGSLVNAAAIIVGGAIGLALHGRFPARARLIVFQALGLSVIVIGMQMALKMTQPLLVIFSLIIGGLIGELLNIEDFLERMGNRIKRLTKSQNNLFTDGLVTAMLIFCVGSMAILGAFDEGLRGDPKILFTKAMLDGFTSIALASTYGAGVLLSSIPVFLYQFSLTLLAGSVQQFFTPELITQLTATGGVLILGIGLNLLELLRIRLSNLLPSLVIVVILSMIFT